jgi:membrane protein insertase Oxa1/YidC/SpoIIIJ
MGKFIPRYIKWPIYGAIFCVTAITILSIGISFITWDIVIFGATSYRIAITMGILAGAIAAFKPQRNNY